MVVEAAEAVTETEETVQVPATDTETTVKAVLTEIQIQAEKQITEIMAEVITETAVEAIQDRILLSLLIPALLRILLLREVLTEDRLQEPALLMQTEIPILIILTIARQEITLHPMIEATTAAILQIRHFQEIRDRKEHHRILLPVHLHHLQAIRGRQELM